VLRLVLLHPQLFFFQAEDGIRDFHVTGVQTCALPIWRRGRRAITRPTRRARSAKGRGWRLTGRRSRPSPGPIWWRGASGRSMCRSEERRVGEEGRDRVVPAEQLGKSMAEHMAV